MINTRLRTSKKTEQHLEELQKVLGLSTKAAIARIAIGLSLNSNNNPLEDTRFNSQDQTGFEFQRHTLFGEYDALYKAMITQTLGKQLSDEEFFPRAVYCHLEQGVYLLFSEYKHHGNRSKLYTYLLNQC
ncbi:MAG: DndE family protein [Turicibacter sp.]|nr:DndE family protein [Turicibacter sp.]